MFVSSLCSILFYRQEIFVNKIFHFNNFNFFLKIILDAYPLGMYYGRPGGSFQTLSMFNPMTALGGMQPSLNALKPFALQPAVKPSSKLNREALSPRTFVPKEPLDSYDKKLSNLIKIRTRIQKG